ncbi:hypothetical protein [Actinokineospora pegani]|uniref:hypothetical protein n=1 Tax=Actinokineospora pegani TaxID=2654637 RepID=UPI0012E9E8E5|nr:hypothetical protein [Actinokineospora pegani]
MAVAAAVLGLTPGTAAAQPAPRDVCAVTDKRLAELSGLVSDGKRWYAVNDGGTRTTVYVLNRTTCAVERVINGPTDPYDVEDLARGADGTFWLADTGDNRAQRESVALIALTPSGETTLYRLTYPDRPRDTEALLLDRDGVPYLVTKSVFGVSDIFRPTGPLASPGPTPLENVGTVQIKSTDTQGGPINQMVGSMTITGGAVSADGAVVALRTYTDAYLFSAPDGDIATALTKGTPARVPLPAEKQGEAIAFEPDGTLVSASEGTGEPIRLVEGAAALAPSPGQRAAGTEDAPQAGAEDTTAEDTTAAAESDNGMATIPALGISAVVVGGVLLVMHRRAKRRA